MGVQSVTIIRIQLWKQIRRLQAAKPCDPGRFNIHGVGKYCYIEGSALPLTGSISTILLLPC